MRRLTIVDRVMPCVLTCVLQRARPCALVLLAAVATPSTAQRDFEVPTRAPADAPSTVTMAGEEEPGKRLVVRGRVVDDSGPVTGVSVFAYQTDAQGIYSEVGNRRPRLRGYARTDAAGRFELRTIRPASYPGSRVQQHIHYHLAPSPDAGETIGETIGEIVGEIVFDDDPLLADRQRRDPSFVVCAPRASDAEHAEICELTLRLR